MLDDDDSGGDDVGYKNPPRQSRWKKGQSGNPAGRRPRSHDLDALILEELNKRVVVNEGGRERSITKREGIAMRLVNGALKGNPRQLEFLFKHMREHGLPDPVDFSADDKADLDLALDSILARREGKAKP